MDKPVVVIFAEDYRKYGQVVDQFPFLILDGVKPIWYQGKNTSALRGRGNLWLVWTRGWASGLSVTEIRDILQHIEILRVSISGSIVEDDLGVKPEPVRRSFPHK